MTVERDTDITTGRRARRWRVPALLASSVLIGTAITVGAAAPSAQADTNISVKLGGTGPLSSVCQAITGKVYALPGSVVSVVTSTTGLKLPVVSNLLSTLNLANAKTIVKNAQNQVVGTATAGKPLRLPTSSGTYTYTNAIDVKVGLPPLVPTKTITVPLVPVPGVAGANATRTLSLVVKPDINGCGVAIDVSVPVNVPIPSVSVGIPGVGVSVGSGSGSSSPTTGSTAPSSGTSAAPKTSSTGTPTNPYDYTAPGCTGPCAVVPKGGGSGGTVGGAYDVTLGDLNDPSASGGSASSSGGSDASAGTNGSDVSLAQGGAQNGANTQIAVDRAFAGTGSDGDSAPGLPTTLTLVAIAALAGSSVLWFARRRLARG